MLAVAAHIELVRDAVISVNQLNLENIDAATGSTSCKTPKQKISSGDTC